MAEQIQKCQARLDVLDADMDRLLAEVEHKRQRLAAETQALRLPLTMLCLETVAELAQQALRKSSCSAAEQHQIQQQLQEPCESSRMAAYHCLRRLHQDCPQCKPKEPCAKGRALLIMRDLVVLTVSLGKGEMNPETLKTALEDAQGCGRNGLDKVELSQLTLAFSKVLSFGQSRDGFDAKVRSANMFGSEISEEQVQHLWMVYSACARASPQYLSKNKASRRRSSTKRSASPQRQLAVAASAASASAASASMPMAMSESSHSQETMNMWQHNAWHGWDVSQTHPSVPEMQPCNEFGFFDTTGYY